MKDIMKTFKEILEENIDPKKFRSEYEKKEKALNKEIDNKNKELKKVLNVTPKNDDEYKDLQKNIDKMIKEIAQMQKSKYEKLQKFYTDYYTKNK